MTRETSKVLPTVSSKQAVANARRELEEGRDGKQRVLLTRWTHLNRMLVGGFRFGKYYVLAGMSGGGKSYMLNMIRKDFLSLEMNGRFPYKYRLIHFAFEMSAADEVLRTVGGNIKVAYQDLISAFKRLPDDKYKEAVAYLSMMEDLDMDFVEVTGTTIQLENTIMQYQGRYPEHRLVVTLDHTLLTEYLNEKDEIQLVSNLSRMALRIRKSIGALVIFVSQLNDKIEDSTRLRAGNQQHPTKKDIHGAKAVYRDADGVMVLHYPSQLGIRQYGPTPSYDTTNRVFLHILKMRQGVPGMVVYTKDFRHGNLMEEFLVSPQLEQQNGG